VLRNKVAPSGDVHTSSARQPRECFCGNFMSQATKKETYLALPCEVPDFDIGLFQLFTELSVSNFMKSV
jgi:hypothetical protein